MQGLFRSALTLRAPRPGAVIRATTVHRGTPTGDAVTIVGDGPYNNRVVALTLSRSQYQGHYFVRITYGSQVQGACGLDQAIALTERG